MLLRPAVVVIRRVVVALVLSVFLGVTAIAQTTPAWAAQYDVTATINVGIDASGVAVSPDGTKAYVANFTANTVSVINTGTNALIGGPITVGTSPSGVAFSPDGTKVYVTNFNADDVSVINTTTNNVDATITVGNQPRGVAVSPDGTRAYVTNSLDGTVSVINTADNTLIATITVGTSPYGVAFSPDGTKVYVTNLSGDTVSVINTTTNNVDATITVGTEPYGVAVSPDGTTAYVTNSFSNTVSVIDLRATASASASADPGVPGIFLAVNDVLVGSQVTRAPIYCGADRIQPNSIYTLSIQSVTNSALTRIILDSGSVNSRGHLDETVLLPKVNPGSYKIVMTGIHASGNLLVLTNFITIGANGGIVSVSPESQQPFLK